MLILFKKIKKYSIFTLSMLLVLSNFSFATQQMLCLMNDDDVTCTCQMNEKADNSNELAFTVKDSPCCSNKVIELTNSNNLQTTENKLPKDITSFSPIYINYDSDITYNYIYDNSFTSLKEHIPKAEIPILNSTLLI